MNITNLPHNMANTHAVGSSANTQMTTDKKASAIKREDKYIPSDPAEAAQQPKLRKLTGAEKQELKAKYNLTNMSYEERTSFLQDLNRAGVISDDDLWVFKYGAVPHEGPLEATITGYVLPKDGSADARAFGINSNTNWLENYTKIYDSLKSRIENMSGDSSQRGAVRQSYEQYSRLVDIMKELMEA